MYEAVYRPLLGVRSRWDATGRCVVAGMGRWGRRWRQVWDAMLSEWRARRSFLGCMQSLRRGRARMGDSHWDATLGCRWIRSLGLRSLWAVTEMRRDVWKLTVIGRRNGMDEMVQGSVVGYGSYWDATGDV